MYRWLLFLVVSSAVGIVACSADHECHGGCACYSYDECPDGCVKSVSDAGKFCSLL